MTNPSKIGHYRDGFFRWRVWDVPAKAATTYAIRPDESGTWFVVQANSTQNLQLPKISSKWLGLTYTVTIEGQASSDDVNINCALDSSAAIHLAFSSDVFSHSTIIPATTDPRSVRLTAASSVVWVAENLGQVYTVTTGTDVGGWTTG